MLKPIKHLCYQHKNAKTRQKYKKSKTTTWNRQKNSIPQPKTKKNNNVGKQGARVLQHAQDAKVPVNSMP